MSWIKIIQVKSSTRRPRVQQQNLIGLGLNRIGKVSLLPDTAETRGMLARVSHLVKIEQPRNSEVRPIEKRRFDALAGYIREPFSVAIYEEINWFATADERVLGVLVIDRIDHDFGFIILGRDERFRFRAVDANHSFSTEVDATIALCSTIERQHQFEDEHFHQGDAPRPPMDFLTPIAEADRLHSTFKLLVGDRKWSPAREIIGAMMRYYDDFDGNFVEQFQTAAFDARLWEIYLYATFTELGYATVSNQVAPDFIFSGPLGTFGLEATTVNPPQGVDPRTFPTNKKDMLEYIENFIPIKLARRLKAKLERRPSYWQEEGMNGIPFVIAIQDFHSPGSMRALNSAILEYVFGIRHSIRAGNITIERIDEHRYGNLRELSGFFNFQNSENISAIVINSQGTLPKFNRIGYLARFGDRRVKMIRTGITRGELNANPFPQPFHQVVHATGYDESWVEGMVVIHNPRALVPLDPKMIPGAAHEFLQDDGRIISLLPAFHPHMSGTSIRI